jgi:hypothetical protein
MGDIALTYLGPVGHNSADIQSGESMSNYRKTLIKIKSVGARRIPLAALVMLGIGAVIGYLGSELILSARPHPMHWLAAGIAAVFGFISGMLLVERFGDVF